MAVDSASVEGCTGPLFHSNGKHSPNLPSFLLTLSLSVITFLGAGRVSLRKAAVKARLGSVGPSRYSPSTLSFLPMCLDLGGMKEVGELGLL